MARRYRHLIPIFVATLTSVVGLLLTLWLLDYWQDAYRAAQPQEPRNDSFSPEWILLPCLLVVVFPVLAFAVVTRRHKTFAGAPIAMGIVMVPMWVLCSQMPLSAICIPMVAASFALAMAESLNPPAPGEEAQVPMVSKEFTEKL